jgi:cysteinyl-tRNA synthetase
MADKYYPTDSWFEDKYRLIETYKTARAEKNFERADKIRAGLLAAGFLDLDTAPKWHPVFESSESRYARLKDVNG